MPCARANACIALRPLLAELGRAGGSTATSIAGWLESGGRVLANVFDRHGLVRRAVLDLAGDTSSGARALVRKLIESTFVSGPRSTDNARCGTPRRGDGPQ